MALLQQVPHPTDEDQIEARRAEKGWAMVAHDITADRELSDEGFRLLAALESWAWNKPNCNPSNRDIAIRAGWFTPKGNPSVDKVKRILNELEGANGRRPYIRRIVGYYRSKDDPTKVVRSRLRIELLRPFLVVEHQTGRNNPPVGKPTTPGAPAHHKEEPPKTRQRVYLGGDGSPGAHEDFLVQSEPVSPGFTPVVSEEVGDDFQEDQRKDMVRLATCLARMREHDPDAQSVVDRFADVSVFVVSDTKASRRYHCKVGWALFKRRMSLASLLGIIDTFCSKHDGLELHHEPGWYVSRVDPRFLPEPGEAACN